MEQHPIPQNISSYEFKLVGDMTLRQFLKAAGGLFLAFLVNSSGIIFLIRWPLMFLFGGGGLALAFLPFRDRPLETWLLSFWKSIYSPTIYTYKKSADKNWMEWKSKEKEEVEENDKEVDMEISNKKKNKLKEYLQSLPSKKNGKGLKNNKKKKEKKGVEGKPVEDEKPEGEVVIKAEINGDNNSDNVLDWRERKVDLKLKTETLEATGKAVFGSIPMPSIPDVPNLVVGMVTDNIGKIVEDAIVEIQDKNGHPVRVLKTNSLGQFRTSTQLINGKYLITTEKEGSDFSRVNVDLIGNIVRPVKIRAIA